MPVVVLSKGFKSGWLTAETGWGTGMVENLGRENAYAVDHWAQVPALSVGLTYAFRGGVALSGGALVRVADGTLALASSTTNYVERTVAGAVSANTSGFTPGSIPLAKVLTGSTSITSVEDWRAPSPQTASGGFVGGTGAFTGWVTGLGFELLAGASAASTTRPSVSNGGTPDELALRGIGAVRFLLGTSAQWSITAAGLLASADNTLDIGAAGANRPRNVYAAGQLKGASTVAEQNSNAAIDLLQATNLSAGTSAAATILALSNATSGYIQALSTGLVVIGSRSSHPVYLATNQTSRWRLLAAGHLTAEIDNAYDIGASGANRPRHIYAAGQIVAGGLLSVGGSISAEGTLTAGAGTLVSLTTSGALTAGGLLTASAGAAITGAVTLAGALTLSTGQAKAARSTGSVAGATTIDLNTGNNHERTLTGAVTLTLSNPLAGAWYTLFLTQGGTGSYTVTWPGSVRWAGGNTAPTLSTAVGKVDVISLYYDGASSSFLAFISGIGF